MFGKVLPTSVAIIHRGLCRTAAAAGKGVGGGGAPQCQAAPLVCPPREKWVRAGGLDRDELAALVVLLRHGTPEALAQLFFYCSADGAEDEERVSVDQLITMLKVSRKPVTPAPP